MSRLEVFPEYISGRIVQSGADTFTEQEIAIPSSLFTGGKGSRSVVTIELISFEWGSAAGGQLADSSDSFSIQLTTNSRSALGNLNQGGTLYRNTLYMHDVGTVGNFQFYEHLHQYHFGGQGGRGRLIGVPKLHVAVDSSGTLAVQTANWRIGFRLVTIDAIRFSRLLTTQASSVS